MASKPIYVAADSVRPRDRYMEVCVRESGVQITIYHDGDRSCVLLGWNVVAAIIESIQAHWPTQSAPEAIDLGD